MSRRPDVAASRAVLEFRLVVPDERPDLAEPAVTVDDPHAVVGLLAAR